jgi:hypothetical protein
LPWRLKCALLECGSIVSVTVTGATKGITTDGGHASRSPSWRGCPRYAGNELFPTPVPSPHGQNVWMVTQIARPGLEHSGHADLPAEMLRIGRRQCRHRSVCALGAKRLSAANSFNRSGDVSRVRLTRRGEPRDLDLSAIASHPENNVELEPSDSIIVLARPDKKRPNAGATTSPATKLSPTTRTKR